MITIKELYIYIYISSLLVYHKTGALVKYFLSKNKKRG